MTPCAAQTVAAAHRRAARAIHHDDATSPYPSAMDLYVTCKTCHPILSPRRPRRAPIPTPAGVLSGCRSRRGEQQRHPAVNVGTSARPSAPSPNPNARWPNVRRPWLTLTLTPFPQVGEALLSDRELAFEAVFYFAPASSTASVAAIRDRHANGRHAPTPNARPYVAPKHYYAHILFFVASSQQPAATSQQRLPRSAPATPTAVTPQRPTVERQTTVVAARAMASIRGPRTAGGPLAVFYFGTRFVNRIGCRDPRSQRQRPPRPNAQRPNARPTTAVVLRADRFTVFVLAPASPTAPVAAIRSRNANGRPRILSRLPQRRGPSDACPCTLAILSDCRDGDGRPTLPHE